MELVLVGFLLSFSKLFMTMNNKPQEILSELIELDGILDRLKDIPNNLQSIFSNALAFLVLICFAIGVILSILGAIQWATGWDDKKGKKSVVKGVVLIAISLALGGLGIGLTYLPI